MTSNYGDCAVSAWGNSAWRAANERLLTPVELLHTDDSPSCGQSGADPAWVCLEGQYDFGALSHLAHWAMIETEDPDGDGLVLQAKYTQQKLTLSPENLASTLCRVLRAWKGVEACRL